MASHTHATRQPVPQDEVTRTFGSNAGASAGVSLDGEIGSDHDPSGPAIFSTKPDPNLRRCMWLMVPLVALSGTAAVLGLFMHMGGTAHPDSHHRDATGAIIPKPTPAAGAAEGNVGVVTAPTPMLTITPSPSPSVTATTGATVTPSPSTSAIVL